MAVCAQKELRTGTNPNSDVAYRAAATFKMTASQKPRKCLCVHARMDQMWSWEHKGVAFVRKRERTTDTCYLGPSP